MGRRLARPVTAAERIKLLEAIVEALREYGHASMQDHEAHCARVVERTGLRAEQVQRAASELLPTLRRIGERLRPN